MSTKVWLSTHGRALDPQDATISVFDRGFLYGDSVYETLRTARGQILGLDAHLDRLRRSAAGIAFELPFTFEEIRRAIEEALLAAGNPDSRVRVTVTRGTGPINLDTRVAESPVLAVIVTPLEIPARAVYLRGISACTVERVAIVRPGLKTGNYLGNILALRSAHERGAEDAIMCNPDGSVAEGATSNLFVIKDGVAHTPSLASGLLAGLTRELVLRLLREILGIETHERQILAAELQTADELFLTSSVRGVMPVTTLDGRVLGEGGAGPLTRRVLDAYDAALNPASSPPTGAGDPG